MKIKTITCHDVYNLGASLQAFALQNYLESEGHDVEVIDYKPWYLSNHYKLWGVGNERFHKPILWQLYNLAKFPGRVSALPRKKVFDEFTKKYLRLTKKYNSFEELRANPPEADVYVAGSDQIWNTTFNNGIDPAFYLNFGTAKKISYAASFATEKLRKGTESFVKEMLDNFNEISVREESGINILKSTGHNGIVVVDPVFLLSQDQWESVSDNIGEGKDYILVYSFEKGGAMQKIAEQLSKLHHCPIYSVGPYKLKYASRNFVNVGPSSFLSLIKNAKCIISNSFHATAFSMIFEKNFFVVNREDGLNTRMKDLLQKYGILDRLISVNVTNQGLCSDIDYSKADELLNRDIKLSMTYLANNLK